MRAAPGSFRYGTCVARLDDSFSLNDALTGGSRPATIGRYGDAALRSTSGNFVLLAAKHGLDRRDIPFHLLCAGGSARGRFR